MLPAHPDPIHVSLVFPRELGTSSQHRRLKPLRGQAHPRDHAQSLNDGEREGFAPRIFFLNLNRPVGLSVSASSVSLREPPPPEEVDL
jgi:hypothetical protein